MKYLVSYQTPTSRLPLHVLNKKYLFFSHLLSFPLPPSLFLSLPPSLPPSFPLPTPQVGARLISHAGSLTSLAKYPASTVQILGAEKALFRLVETAWKNSYGTKLMLTMIGTKLMLGMIGTKLMLAMIRCWIAVHTGSEVSDNSLYDRDAW